MKKLLLLIVLMAGFFSLKAQTPDDLVISGYVTNSNGLAVNNIQVCVSSDSLNPNPFYQCTTTNANGWYTITVTNGSLTGANQYYAVTMTNCNNVILHETVQNMQGTVNAVTVNFTYCQVGCTANFTYQHSGNVFSFNSSSSTIPSGTIIYSWNFGDSTATSSVANPTHTYANYGTYNVCLTITNNNGCSDTYCHTVTVSQNSCGLSFSYTQNSNGSYSFLPTMSGTISNPTYLWNFGDGTTSTNHDPSHLFATAGLYNVCLTVSGGGISCTYCDSAYFNTTTNTCDANFTYQINGLAVSFTSTSTNTANQYYWSFGNGTTSSVYNPTVTFTAAGTYTVCHYVYNTSTNCADTACLTITVGNTSNCMVSYSYNTQNLLPNQVQFTGQLTSGTGPFLWYWNFGDGTTGTGDYPLHQYAQPGYYSVCVFLHQNSGTILCQYCDSIYVSGSSTSCQANFTYTQSGTAVSFNSSNSIYSSSPVLYTWNFGDGTTSTLANPVHTFTNYGTYNVCLTISSNNCTDTYCHTVTIGQSNICNISFAFTQNPNGGYSFLPTYPSTITNPQFHWDFGDGQTSTNHDPSHAYVNAGAYTVCLTISGGGLTCTYCDSAYFNSTNTACNASFTTQISGLSVAFSGSMTNTNATNYWSFGNGTTSTLANPTITYTTPGTYTVCHHVQTNNCSDSICQTITVGNTINCNVSYTYNTQNLQPLHVQFFGQITPNSSMYYWAWDFGDGTTVSGQQNPVHEFAQAGSYVVCVSIYQSNGTISCTYCDSVYVPAQPVVTCNANFTYQQSGANVHFFSNNSGTPSSTTMSYYWDFGDGSSSTLVNPYHSFTTAGTYNVCLTVTDSLNNCTNQFCQNIIVGTNTTCQATFQYTFGSLFNVAFFGNFTPLSTATHWYWSFGDSTTANVQNPVHSYANPGTYQVCLTVVTASGTCPSVTYCQTITIQGNTPGCQAYYTYQISNTEVHFQALNNSSTPGQFMHYYWTFGDSTTSNLQNPVHNYSGMGTYNVCLTIVDSLNGCSDQFCQTITLGNNIQLSGQIFTGNNNADAGTVYLLSVTPNSPNSILPIASTPILTGGYYQFSNIPYGQYLIQAHLSTTSAYYFDYLPTYYGDVLYWSQATFVSIGQVNLTVQYDIHMIGTNLNNGNGQISGNVLQGNGSKTTLSDILVVLLDENDNAITYTYSDIDGSFAFDNLAMGTYKVYAEIWGKDPVSATVTLDSNNPTVDDVLITVNETTVISSLPGYNEMYFDFVGNPYPNPTSDNINLELSLKQNTHLVINVYNIMGASVYAQNGEFTSGVHRMNFNTNSLPAGLYYIDIVADNKFRVSKIFNKIK